MLTSHLEHLLFIVVLAIVFRISFSGASKIHNDRGIPKSQSFLKRQHARFAFVQPVIIFKRPCQVSKTMQQLQVTRGPMIVSNFLVTERISFDLADPMTRAQDYNVVKLGVNLKTLIR